MANRILAFPTEGAATQPGTKLLGNTLRKAAQPEAVETSLGPQLIYSRPQAFAGTADSASLSQAEHISLLVDREVAQRAQREAAERRTAQRIAPIAKHRPALASVPLPPQATEVGLRHRRLAALLSFGRPA